MISAYTMVRVILHKNTRVLEKIKTIPIVKETALIYGEYDILVKTETKSLEELNQFIYNVLRKIPYITKTTTMIVARPPKTKSL